jgi:hypothetical protein
MRGMLTACLLLVCSCLHAQDLKKYLLVERRGGVIEIVDPATLDSVSQLRFDVRNTTGLNGIAASPDGSMLYVEGPITDPAAGSGNCCFLYSVDLETLHAQKAAGIWGTSSRAAFVPFGGSLFKMADLSSESRLHARDMGRLYLDASHHFLFGVRSFPGPSLDIYDLHNGSILRSLTPDGWGDHWFASGAWSGDQFYLYAAGTDELGGHLWAVSPETTQLGPGVAVAESGQMRGCSTSVRLEEMVAAGDHLFIYEMFGSKLDRRDRCGSDISGGVWLLDPQTGKLLRHDAPNLHFTRLIPDQTEPTLYGVAAEGHSGGPEAPVQLVRIDTRDGHVLASRQLDVDYWWLAEASLRAIPNGEVKITP